MPEIANYHRKYLETASEQNTNNARVPDQATKGYRDCLEAGWIIEKPHPNGHYRYFEITEAGERALSTPKPFRDRKAPRLKMIEQRLKPPPPRLGSGRD
jgi:hypothetical protein